MTHLTRTLLGCMAAIAIGAQSVGAATLDLVPSATTVNSGDTISVDVTIGGLGNGHAPSLGAFDLDVGFNPALLQATGITFGPYLGDPLLLEALTDARLLAGIIDIAEVSLLSDSELDLLQPSAFTLATLSFQALADGDATFGFVGEVRLDDPFGNKLPVPGSLALLLVGGLALWLVNRRPQSTNGDAGPDI